VGAALGRRPSSGPLSNRARCASRACRWPLAMWPAGARLLTLAAVGAAAHVGDPGQNRTRTCLAGRERPKSVAISRYAGAHPRARPPRDQCNAELQVTGPQLQASAQGSIPGRRGAAGALKLGHTAIGAFADRKHPGPALWRALWAAIGGILREFPGPPGKSFFKMSWSAASLEPRRRPIRLLAYPTDP